MNVVMFLTFVLNITKNCKEVQLPEQIPISELKYRTRIKACLDKYKKKIMAINPDSTVPGIRI
jgi:hypothetical protein